jgi:hypothetical protein
MSTETILTIVYGLLFSGVIILWVEGIDYLKKNHTDNKKEEDKEKND